MKFSTTLLLSIASLATASPTPLLEARYLSAQVAATYESIHQAEYGLADALDKKNWGAIGDYMTKDVVYDNSQFQKQGRPGGVARGLDEVIKSTKKAFAGAQVSHSVTTAKIELLGPGKAHVITYLIYSHWDPKHLYDPKKTFRVYEQCDDIWVLDSGLWKLQYSLVTDMGPDFEAIYYGHDDGKGHD